MVKSDEETFDYAGDFGSHSGSCWWCRAFSSEYMPLSLCNLAFSSFSELSDIKQQLICYENGNYQPTAEDRLDFGNYCNLLRGRLNEIDFQLSDNTSGLIIEGSLSPFRVHDIYALDLTLRIKNTVEISQLDQLNIQSHLSSFNIDFQPSLGQTLLFYAETQISSENYPDLAHNCISQLMPSNSNLELVSEGKILGCSVFVYDNWEIELNKQNHILLFFNSSSTPPEKLGEASRDLLLLMCSYHKILYAYNQSRSCKHNCTPLYKYLEEQIKNFSQTAQSHDRLQNFKQLLSELPQKSLEYSKILRDLEDHKNTIKNNIFNYEKLTNKLQQLSNREITFLQAFLDYAQNKLSLQIKADQNFLIPGQKMFQELISNIRGIVAIDQVESDRKFQLDLQTRDEQFQKTLQEQRDQREDDLRIQEENEQKREKKIEWWITFVGTALAVSGISSAVVTDPAKTILKNFSRELFQFCLTNNLCSYFSYGFLDILFHVFVGILMAFVAVIILALFKKLVDLFN